MQEFETVIVGGGAAGICGAISSARSGRSVVICEKMPQLGKKILATGNGRCNLLNDNLSEKYYNAEAREIVKKVFNKFGKSEILGLFHNLGLATFSQDGRIFPFTNQAASVKKVLEMELQRLNVRVENEFTCSSISNSGKNFVITANDGKQIVCKKIIIAAGGKSYPALGSDGSGYEIAAKLGHTIIEPVPAAVPLVVKDSLCHALQGQRIFAVAQSVIEGIKHEAVKGELLFTNYGLSGTCILDISEEISIAINRNHKSDVYVDVDLVPFMEKVDLIKTLQQRQQTGITSPEVLIGILPNKLSFALKAIFEKGNVGTAANVLKNYRFKVAATKTWNEAEFTNGGVDVSEINPDTLESRKKPGIYFAGEVLDVNGKRGGYNLGWAWASGFVAGETL